ncbi:DNA-binding transcriptional regulator, LysR family [Kosakonia arachidis]|uniref:DNA-binding transcriptional regulator, LysR family n=1 Tax=Kosakonia arachidis TaxID=551989 RepID=A0A1I6Z7Q3_9ENTR|nr:LysR family transcriptional regulator [Kosakonia arachidis]SFT58742.1 DNA-binding transcriptional regulator, LysR family [Kosakonia arachidis]
MDLNLLTSLNILIEEANVTRAAARLGISQPALSTQLARLRDIFGDPLLVPSATSRGMVLTARAMSLRDPLREALQSIDTIVRQPDAFDPLTANRRFSIAASDYAATVLGVPLAGFLTNASGSGIQVSFQNLLSEPASATLLERGDVDLLIGRREHLQPAVKARKLFEDSFVVAQRKKHPRGTRSFTIESYCTCDHLLVSPVVADMWGVVDNLLEDFGHQRRVTMSVQQFMLAPPLVESSNLLCTLPKRFVRQFRDRLDFFPLPFDVPTINIFMAWHPRFDADPAHIWIREQIIHISTKSLLS